MINTNVTVLYGSETGTAQDVAEQIWKSAKRKGLNSTVSNMDDYEIQSLSCIQLAVFVVATTGQGDPPNNMRKFWKLLLRKTLPSNILENLQYGVLGLGDSSYQKFNFAAKKLNKRLTQLGAVEIVPIGLADDQHDLGIDAVVDPWIQNLWSKVSNVFHFPMADNPNNNNLVIERFEVCKYWKENSKDLVHYYPAGIYTHELSINNQMKIGIVVENIRTTSDTHFQDVRLIKLQSSDISYEPGDILYIRPKNSTKSVEKFFQILEENNVKLNPDMLIRISEKEIKVPYVLRQILTLGQIVQEYWDLNFKPRRSTMQTLFFISENELEKEKLYEFTTAAGQEELFSYINRPRRNILELLADFPHTTSKLTLQLLFEIMSPIKPRAFSIASSSKKTKDEIHILVAVVKYKTKLVEPRLGLCSNWLASLTKEDKVIYWIEKGTFEFRNKDPMILVGPGTGVAPFRSLLLDRAAKGFKLDNIILFFGSRNKERDYHCKEDFEHLAKENGLKLFCAFSRDQDHKIYVQNVIHDQRVLCWEFLSKGGSIYLAGSSKNMPNSVREEFVSLVQDLAQFTNEQAAAFITQLEQANRYQTETWG